MFSARARPIRTVESRPPAPRSPGGPSGSLVALRAAVCGATLALTAYATAELGRVLSPNGHTALDLVAIGLLQVPEDLSSDEMLTVFERPSAPAALSAITALADRRAWAWHALTVV